MDGNWPQRDLTIVDWTGEQYRKIITLTTDLHAEGHICAQRNMSADVHMYIHTHRERGVREGEEKHSSITI